MKRATLIALLLAAGFAGFASAQSHYRPQSGASYGSSNYYGGSSYNSYNGNSYNSSGHGYQGYNSNTGSSWSSQSYGSTTNGIDSRGNSWSYDRGTGTYQNYGTGEVRSHGQRW